MQSEIPTVPISTPIDSAALDAAASKPRKARKPSAKPSQSPEAAAQSAATHALLDAASRLCDFIAGRNPYGWNGTDAVKRLAADWSTLAKNPALWSGAWFPHGARLPKSDKNVPVSVEHLVSGLVSANGSTLARGVSRASRI